MKNCLLRFNTEKGDWRLQFDNGEVLFANSVIFNCSGRTASNREKGTTKYYIHLEYNDYKWSQDMKEITFN